MTVSQAFALWNMYRSFYHLLPYSPLCVYCSIQALNLSRQAFTCFGPDGTESGTEAGSDLAAVFLCLCFLCFFFFSPIEFVSLDLVRWALAFLVFLSSVSFSSFFFLDRSVHDVCGIGAAFMLGLDRVLLSTVPVFETFHHFCKSSLSSRGSVH